jgi:hypothetical protein
MLIPSSPCVKVLGFTHDLQVAPVVSALEQVTCRPIPGVVIVLG